MRVENIKIANNTIRLIANMNKLIKTHNKLDLKLNVLITIDHNDEGFEISNGELLKLMNNRVKELKFTLKALGCEDVETLITA